MSERVRMLLTHGVAAAKAGDKDEAQHYLEWVLILLPVWMTKYRYQEAIYDVVINGENCVVQGQTPPGKVKRWLRKLLD